MLRRFLAASGTAAALITIPTLIVMFIRPVAPERAYLPLTLWCFAPAVWGVWAMLAPRSWVPNRLPGWGAILGLFGSFSGAVVLNLPSRVFDVPVALWLRLAAVALITAMYALLWYVVRLAYEELIPATAPPPEPYDLLDALRHHAVTYPELDDAVKRLEVALANLTVRTSGML